MEANAYQIGKTPLDAVIRLLSALKLDVMFISQYDFSSYFDAIEHKYVRDILSEHGVFLTTSMERRLLNSILEHEFIDASGISKTRTCGTPQGNSLSLFIANVAAHPLDEELSRLNGTFARFADDSVVVNTTYEDALRTAEAFHRFSKKSGVAINSIKSSGIRMFSDTPMEMANICEFVFLGYSFKRSGIYMSDRAITAIKRRCSQIIYNHLLLHLRRTKSLSKKRIGLGFRDWDLVTCINELRSYIYGGLSQSSIDLLLSGSGDIRNVSGAVSYFALVADSSGFRQLDGWLADVLSRAYVARVQAAAQAGRTMRPLTKRQFVTGSWYKFPALAMETKLPSFFTAWRSAKEELVASWAWRDRFSRNGICLPVSRELDYYDNLAKIMLATRGSRFTAAHLLTNRDRFSVFTLAMLSIFLIGLSVVLLAAPDVLGSKGSKYFGTLSIVASVWILVITLFDYALGRGILAHQLHQNAIRITLVVREMERELAKPNPDMDKIRLLAEKYELSIRRNTSKPFPQRL